MSDIAAATALMRKVTNTPVLGIWDMNPSPKPEPVVQCPDCGALLDRGQNCTRCS